MGASLSHRAQGALAICAVIVGLSACADDSTAGPSTGSSTVVSSASPVASPSAASQTPSTETEDEYTPEQLAAYDGAVERWAEYEQVSEPVWAAGEVTDAARKMFQTYFVSPVWQQYLSRLQTYQDSQVTITGLPTILWSQPRSVELSPEGDSVVVRQCVDYSSQSYLQAGDAVARYQDPVLRTATLDRSGKDDNWRLLRIDEPSGSDFKRCEVQGS